MIGTWPDSTDAEVGAAYEDNASQEEDASRAKALAFITACRILRRRRPVPAGRDRSPANRSTRKSRRPGRGSMPNVNEIRIAKSEGRNEFKTRNPEC